MNTSVDTNPPNKNILWQGKCGEHNCALMQFIFTVGLLVDYRERFPFHDYSARYCYPEPSDAIIAAMCWDGIGDPPGNWAKEKVSGRLGPALLNNPLELGDS